MAVPRRNQVVDWLYDVGAVARRAAQRALQSRTANRTVQVGASGAPSAEFDVATERAILRTVRDAPIPLNVASEELGEIQNGAEWTLVVDPVDGSRNAAHGIPFYCVSLALARGDLSGVEIGFIQDIPHGGVYLAERKRGAALDGRRIRPRALDESELLVGAALDYEQGVRLPKTTAKTHFRDLGSAALEMCMVADGRLDAFLATKPYIRVIDIAASTLVLREAGGRVWDLRKQPLNVPLKVRHRFGLVAAGHVGAWRFLR